MLYLGSKLCPLKEIPSPVLVLAMIQFLEETEMLRMNTQGNLRRKSEAKQCQWEASQNFLYFTINSFLFIWSARDLETVSPLCANFINLIYSKIIIVDNLIDFNFSHLRVIFVTSDSISCMKLLPGPTSSQFVISQDARNF